jgi:CubicO group peptidase (beta-lactamase class C family)
MNDGDLQQLLDTTGEKLGVMGAQLALYDGESMRQFVTGYRNRELGLRVTPHTVFQIGSTTKLSNAALILSLVEADKLDLDTPVREYIPGLRLADVEAEKTITLRQLLSMTAGLDNGPYYDFGRGDDALARYVEAFSGIPQVFAPGSAFGYSNAASDIAGYAASCVTGQTWERLVAERIWAPVGLKETVLFAEDLLQHPVALGYKKMVSGNPVERTAVWSSPRAQAPSGSLTCSSAGDLIRLARLFLGRGKSAEGVKVLSEAAIETMQQVQVRLPTRLVADEWCLGPYRREWDGHVLYGHSGTNFSGSSALLWCPAKQVAIATVVNVADQGYPLADAIFDVVFPRVFSIRKPAAPTPQDVTPVQTDLQPYEGRFEAFGMTCTFSIAGNGLKLTTRTPRTPERDVTGSDLISLGEGRFLPCDPRVSGNRNWDIAFWGHDSSGLATHLLQGVFPLRRTS